jgi:hypothetical protein
MMKVVIRKYRRKLEKSVKENDRSVLAKAYIKLLDVARPLYFSEEFLLLNGLKGKVESDQKSVLFFTVHKSASTFIEKTVLELLKNKTLATINFSGYLSKRKQEAYYNDDRLMKKVLRPRGYFYGAFRSFYNFPGLDKFKILLVLRDPRDVLTSYYFSTLYNHPLGRKEVFEERKKYANTTIDEFVLERAPEFKKRYQDYCEHLLGKEHVLLLKYEEMITQFGSWLQKLSAFLGLKDNTEALDAIVAKTSFKVEKEDPHSFIRNIKAQDHKDKLKPETIAKLTALFKNELMQLEYDLE